MSSFWEMHKVDLVRKNDFMTEVERFNLSHS